VLWKFILIFLQKKGLFFVLEVVNFQIFTIFVVFTVLF